MAIIGLKVQGARCNTSLDNEAPSDEFKKRKMERLKKWGQLLLGISGIVLFMAVIVPFFTKNKMTKEVLDYAEEREIDTRALFYTDSEAAVKAEFLMRQK